MDRNIRKFISRFTTLNILFNQNNNGIKHALVNIKGYGVIKRNNLFDEDFYLRNNDTIQLADTNPILHYIYHGFKEGKDPNPNFDNDGYLRTYPDVRKLQLNPLIHFSLYGMHEERIVPILKDQTEFEQHIPLTEDQINEKIDEIANKNRDLIKLHNFDDDSPLVSIIILNRNGIKHLERLFENFVENIQYPSYEVIVVDNASKDNSLKFLDKLSSKLHLKIIKNIENKSFSKANNQALQIADGDFILLLNNDVEPTYGWLNIMMQTAITSENIGAVGAKLIYPDCSISNFNYNKSFKIQHAGIAFKNQNGFIRPYNITYNDLLWNESNSQVLKAAVTAATLLVKKDKYLEVGGLEEGYDYGYEDVDFCLKLLEKGYENIYCPTALLFHYEFGTQELDEKFEVRTRRSKNMELFKGKWNSWLQRKLFTDKLNSRLIFSESPLKVAFVVTEKDENTSTNDYFIANELGKRIKKIGWKISYLQLNEKDNPYELEDDIDVLISLSELYDIDKIKSTNKSMIKIAYTISNVEGWVNHNKLSKYDIIFASDENLSDYILKRTGLKSILLSKTTTSNNFNSKTSMMEGYGTNHFFKAKNYEDSQDTNIKELIDMIKT